MPQRIAIVGNGPIRDGIAGAIDASDIVIRFNDCRSRGAGGEKTDVVAVCNTGRPAKAMLSGDWLESDALRRAREIWGVRDPDFFAALRPLLAESHPDLDDFCDDYSADFTARAGERFRTLPASAHRGVDEALKAYEPAPYVVPSSGAIVIGHVLDSVAGDGDCIAIAGFGHQGWVWHPFAAEKRWVDALIAARKLDRLDPVNTSATPGEARHVL